MRDIQGFEGLYAITKDGRVWSYEKRWYTGKPTILFVKKARWLKPRLTKAGYWWVHLRKGVKGNGKYKTIHRLVAQTYIPNPKSYKCVNHINFIRTDNRVENLEWCSYKMNTQHGALAGRFPTGENHHNSLLNEQKIREIRSLRKSGMLHRQIAERLGINRSTVSQILRGETWKQAI